jgi:phosphoribosylanthranilate isomerase
MWVKICANTNLKDAAVAAELGADAVGFVFAASKRQVTIPQVAAITAALSTAIERIGVFDSQDADEIAEAAFQARLSAVQLHTGYDEPLIQRLHAVLPERVEIIPTLHWIVGEDSAAAADQTAFQLERIAAAGLVGRVLIDSKVKGASGGTGISFDWNAARQVFAEAPQELKLILAGGLSPDNVADAIVHLRPSGVDVASGVEASVGRKNPTSVAEFIQRARSASKL